MYMRQSRMLLLPFFLDGVWLLGLLLKHSFAIHQPALFPSSFGGVSAVPSRQESPLRGAVLVKNVISFRGGEIDLPSDNDDGVVMKKFRNVVRSFLKFSDNNAPPLASVVRLFCKTVESISGVRLLPPKKRTNLKKKKSKSASKGMKRKDDENDGETESAKPKAKKSSANRTKSSAATKKHLTTEIKSTNPNFRIQKELKEFIKSPPPNLSVHVGSNIRVWIITMVGAKDSIYEGEVFKLRVSFPAQYPTVPPSVYFLQGHIPTHEHVYTNGDICLSLLGKDWRPTMTAQSIAVSILSILSSAQSKALPMDNARHAGSKPGEYQKDWVYHDDRC